MHTIPDTQVDRAIHIVDSGDLPQLLTDALDLAPQGRPRRLTLRTWLVGCFLAVEAKGSFKTTSIHEVLTSSISIDKRYELGVRYEDKNGNIRQISKSQCDYIPRWLKTRLACTPTSIAKYELDVDEAGQQRRRQAIESFSDALLSATIVEPGTGWYALDGSGTWSWGKAKWKIKTDRDIRAEEDVHEPSDHLERVPDEVADEIVESIPDGADGSDDDDAGEASHDESSSSRRSWAEHHDPDARTGVKTAKMAGREFYYGYVMDAAIQVRQPGQPKRPVVIERLRISPANADVVAPTLSILDSLLEDHGNVTDIVVDRHYSHKDPNRWADELVTRDINQHFDMRKDDHGFTDHDGMKLAAGWMHCPATPDELSSIPRPGPGASPAEVKAFRDKIAERFSWAMDRHTSISDNGRTRWTCPAVAGKRGCPLRPATEQIAKEAGLPIVSEPPTGAENLACCSNTSGVATATGDRVRKHQQPHYWGNEKWQEAYDLRTYVEGAFGSFKNRDTEDISRGYTKFVGLPMMTLAVSFAAAVCNVRHQRNHWLERDDRPDHPLLQADPTVQAWAPLTDDQVAELDKRHLGDETQEAA